MGAVYFKFPKLFFHPNEVRGLGFQRKRLECHSPSKWGQYEIRCDGTGRDFASFVHNRATREKILRQYYSVFNSSPELPSAVLQVLRERKKFALALGFKSWSEMQAVMNSYDYKWTKQFVEELWKSGQPGIRQLVSRMRAMPTDIDGSRSPSTTTVDEQYLLTQLRGPLELKHEKHFEYNTALARILDLVADLFSVRFEPVQQSLWNHGWHKLVKPLRVTRPDGSHIGYIYVDLFRRPMSSPLAGAGPHCSVLNPADSQVRVFMGLHPPYRSDVTFKKERFFTYEEITALMHELGHAMHILLRPRGSALSQLPLDVRETVSVLMELYSLSTEGMERISNKQLGDKDKQRLKRDEWFYVDIIRNVAVSEHIHSEDFDPDSATPDDLVRVCREVYARYSPVKVSDFVNPLGGELANYLVDGESRIGYLVSYARASSVLRDRKVATRDLMKALNEEVVGRSFHPSVSEMLESRKSGKTSPDHPITLPQLIRKDRSDGLFSTSYVGSIWDNLHITLPRNKK